MLGVRIRTTNINWAAVKTIVVAVTAVWIGLATLLPPDLYRVVSIILVAIQSGLIVLVRSGNHAEDSVPPEVSK
jgi:hypothetical protein